MNSKVNSSISSGGNAGLKVSVISFAYSIGMPVDDGGDGWDGFVFDCRALPDPYFEKGLSEYSGLDQPVIDFFNRHKERLVDITFRSRNVFVDSVHQFPNFINPFVFASFDSRISLNSFQSFKS